MEGLFAFQRTGAAVSLTTTTGLSSSAAITIAQGGMAEIVNVSATDGAAFIFTDAGASSATAATTAMRTVPPLGTLYEQLPQGASYIAGIAAISGVPTIVVTPGVSNG